MAIPPNKSTIAMKPVLYGNVCQSGNLLTKYYESNNTGNNGKIDWVFS